MSTALFPFFVENYHHLFDVLSRLKIPGMEGYREEAKRNYKKYIEQYCRHSLGRPLEKLSVRYTHDANFLRMLYRFLV